MYGRGKMASRALSISILNESVGDFLFGRVRRRACHTCDACLVSSVDNGMPTPFLSCLPVRLPAVRPTYLPAIASRQAQGSRCLVVNRILNLARIRPDPERPSHFHTCALSHFTDSQLRKKIPSLGTRVLIG